MLYYHGTTMAYAKLILKYGIDPEKNAKSELDFGKGLYFSDKETAIKFAKRKADETKLWSDIPDPDYTIPVIIPVEVNEKAFDNLKVLFFKKKTLRWCNFIFNTRLHHRETNNDVIIGPIADGAIDIIMSKVKHLPLFIAKAIAYIHFYGKDHRGHLQYVLKTDKAVKVVKLHKPQKV